MAYLIQIYDITLFKVYTDHVGKIVEHAYNIAGGNGRHGGQFACKLFGLNGSSRHNPRMKRFLLTLVPFGRIFE